MQHKNYFFFKSVKISQSYNHILIDYRVEVRWWNSVGVHSVELRELEAMLKAAYVSKAHTTQMAEKAALKTEEKAMDVAAAHVMMEQCRREEEAERQRELAQYMRVRKYQQEVKRQMEVSQTVSHSHSHSHRICTQWVYYCSR